MGKMLIILVTSFAVLFGITAYNMTETNTRMVYNAVDEYTRIQAKDLAESGIEWGIMQIAQDTSWAAFRKIQVGEGAMWVDVDHSSSRYPQGPNVGERGKQIVSTGLYHNQMVTVMAIVQIPITPEVPPWMRYAIMSDRTLDLGGNIMVRDDNNASWNADVHTNQNLDVNGSVLVTGFGTYVNSRDFRPNNPSRFFTPNVNPDGQSVSYQSPRIDIPVLDPSEYIAIATHVYSGSQTTITGNTLGSHESPAIIYVEGDLHISGNFTGYGVFIVAGDVHITGNVNLTSVDPLGNNLGIYGANDIIFHGNADASGQIFAEGDVVFSGNNDVHGLVTNKGEMDFRGDVNIFYRPASPNLTSPFWPGDMKRPRIISYYQ